MNRLKESLSAFWQERNARERAMLTLALTVIAAALLYLVCIAPALGGRVQLEKNLPALRQQAAEMQALSKQAADLSSAIAQPLPALTKESIEAALARKGLKPQSVVVSGELVKVQLGAVSFSGVLDWLDDMQKMARVSIADANIVVLPPIDTVNATFTLRQQKNEE